MTQTITATTMPRFARALNAKMSRRRLTYRVVEADTIWLFEHAPLGVDEAPYFGTVGRSNLSFIKHFERSATHQHVPRIESIRSLAYSLWDGDLEAFAAETGLDLEPAPVTSPLPLGSVPLYLEGEGLSKQGLRYERARSPGNDLLLEARSAGVAQYKAWLEVKLLEDGDPVPVNHAVVIEQDKQLRLAWCLGDEGYKFRREEPSFTLGEGDQLYGLVTFGATHAAPPWP